MTSLTQHDRQLAHQLRKPLREPHATHLDYKDSLREENITAQPEPVPFRGLARHTHTTSDRAPHFSDQGQVSEKPDSTAISFEQLSRLSDADLALVFRESDSKLSLLALAGATPSFVDRLLKQLPSREAKALQRRMEQLGPLRLSDIAQAQNAVAAIADRLISIGAIRKPEPKHFAVAA